MIWCFLFFSDRKLPDYLCRHEKEGDENCEKHLHLQPGLVGPAPLRLYPIHLDGRPQQAIPVLQVATGMQVTK